MDVAVKCPWTMEEFERQLRAKGDRYHIHHPSSGADATPGICTREAGAGVDVQSISTIRSAFRWKELR